MTRRMIDSAFWESESLAKYDFFRRLFFNGIICHADDQGRLRAHPALLRSKVFPYDDIPIADVEAALKAYVSDERILIYDVGGTAYLQLVKWWQWQDLNWARPSDYPAPPGWTDRHNYRVGNAVIKENWDQSGGRAESEAQTEPDQSEPTLGPEWESEKPAPSIEESSIEESRVVVVEAAPDCAVTTAPPTTTEQEYIPSEAFRLWEARSGTIGLIDAEQIDALIDECEKHRQGLPRGAPGWDVTGDGWVAAAILEGNASKNGGMINLKYVGAILDRWRTEGYKAPKGGKDNRGEYRKRKEGELWR